MDKLKYYIVDVFAQGKYTGNQLAVFRNAKYLTSKEMQQIAKEINYAETTFILSDISNGGKYDVRIFTPIEEIPFAGHPTLGTAFIIENEILEEPVHQMNLNYQAGIIPVSLDDQEQIFWMRQNEPTFGQTLERQTISDVLNISKECIDDRYPIHEVSTGLPAIVVPLKSLEAVKKVQINKTEYFKLIEHTDAKSIMVFAPETYQSDNDLNVRDFAEYYGIPEDAATGSSNGCLAAYLIKHNFFGKNRLNLRVEQGYEIDRPSLLFLKANKQNQKINVHVGGKVNKVAEGDWFL